MEDKVIQNAIQCPDGTLLLSRHIHDYVDHTQKDGRYYAVDGGLSYCCMAYSDRNYTSLQLTLETPFTVLKNNLIWGVLENGTLKYKFLKDLSLEHLKNILKDYYLKLRTIRILAVQQLILDKSNGK